MADQSEWDGQSRRSAASGDYRSNNSFDKMKTKTNPNNISLDNIDVIDLDGLSLDEEDVWLYKLKEIPKDSPSPYAWVRQEFEDRNRGTQQKSLLNLLDIASKRKVSRILQYPDSNTDFVSTQSRGPSQISPDNRLLSEPNIVLNNTLDSSKELETTICGAVGDAALTSANDLSLSDSDSIQNTPKSKGRYEIDTRTFTRPKKNKTGIKMINPIKLGPELDEQLPDGVNAEVCDKIVDECSKETCAVDQASPEFKRPEEPSLKPEDLTDVQVLARMQEESLRNYCSSPLSYTPKLQRRGFSESTGRLIQGTSRSSLSCSSDVSSPNLSHDNPNLIVKSTNSLCSSGSESPTSRSESLTNIIPAQSKTSRELGNVHQRSLPNLMKAAKFGLPPSLPSDSKLYASSEKKSLPFPAQERIKSTNNSAPKKSSLISEVDVAETVVPPVDSVPSSVPLKTPVAVKSASGIPRPGFSSKLKQPTKWKKGLTTPAQTDGSWKEGCF